jgi:hypothetical protein
MILLFPNRIIRQERSSKATKFPSPSASIQHAEDEVLAEDEVDHDASLSASTPCAEVEVRPRTKPI